MNVNTLDNGSSGQNEFPQLVELLRKYWMPAATGVCVVAAIAVSTVLYRSHAQKKQREASAMLLSARTVRDLETVMDRHPSAPTAPLALLKLSKMYFNAGNYDMALNKYTEFKIRFPDNHLAGAAELGRIYCLEAMGQLEDALAAFTAFAEERPDHFMVSQGIFGRARCLEQMGRRKEAKAIYEDFIAARSDSVWVPIAEELLASVNKKIKKRRQTEL